MKGKQLAGLIFKILKHLHSFGTCPPKMMLAIDLEQATADNSLYLEKIWVECQGETRPVNETSGWLLWGLKEVALCHLVWNWYSSVVIGPYGSPGRKWGMNGYSINGVAASHNLNHKIPAYTVLNENYEVEIDYSLVMHVCSQVLSVVIHSPFCHLWSLEIDM